MAKNPLKTDPSRTLMIRKRFDADMKRRFKKISKAIYELIIKNDAFGLNTNIEPFQINVEKQVWRFRTDPKKVEAFRGWLTEQVNQDILSTNVSGEPWLATHIESSYKKGALRGQQQVYGSLVDSQEKQKLIEDQQFLRASFAGSEETKRVEAIYSRAWNDLKGVTDAMGQKLSRDLALGLSQGQGAVAIARAMTKNIEGLTRTRAIVIARTEVIAAHAEGQLDSYERLGIKEVQVQAEWMTAGDNRVCPECETLEGATLTVEEAHGLLPRHPQCRCAWAPKVGNVQPIPAEKIKQSIARERQVKGKDGVFKYRKGHDFKLAKERSSWLGKTKLKKK